MKFRPCIDLHSGQVKQIVGSTLKDDDKKSSSGSKVKNIDQLATNFETDRPAADYAAMYQRDGLVGGHVIMLGPGNDQSVSDLSALKLVAVCPCDKDQFLTRYAHELNRTKFLFFDY